MSLLICKPKRNIMSELCLLKTLGTRTRSRRSNKEVNKFAKMAASSNLRLYFIAAAVVLVLYVNQGDGSIIHCNTTQFPCKNDIPIKCVSKTAVCNGVKDCPDGSDELNCKGIIRPTPQRPSSSSESAYYHDLSKLLRKYISYTPSCEGLWSTNFCTDRGSTQCCPSTGYLGLGGSSCCASTQTPYTTCKDSYGYQDLCTKSRSTHCCNGACCRTSRRTSTTGGFGGSTSAVSRCSHWLDDTFTITETCWNYYVYSPSCCNTYGTDGWAGQTCCHASSSTSTASTTSDNPWYTDNDDSINPWYTDNDDSGGGSGSSGGGSGVVIGGVGGSVGLVVVLAIICGVFRAARIGMCLHNSSPANEGRTRTRRVLVIRPRNSPVCAENPGCVAPQSVSPSVTEPPAYSDVVDPSAGGAAAPPSYDDAVNTTRDNAPLVDVRA